VAVSADRALALSGEEFGLLCVNLGCSPSSLLLSLRQMMADVATKFTECGYYLPNS